MFHSPAQLRRDALDIWQAGVEAVCSERLVAETLCVEGQSLRIGRELLPLDAIRAHRRGGGGKGGGRHGRRRRNRPGTKPGRRKAISRLGQRAGRLRGRWHALSCTLPGRRA